MQRPPTESELRHVCEACGYIDYYNPKLVRSVRRTSYEGLTSFAAAQHDWTPRRKHDDVFRPLADFLQCGCLHHIMLPALLWCLLKFLKDGAHKVLTACARLQVVGCIVEHEGKILLCRRAIQPCKGLWTVPAGFLEMGESTAAGAARETWEEANAAVEV